MLSHLCISEDDILSITRKPIIPSNVDYTEKQNNINKRSTKTGRKKKDKSYEIEPKSPQENICISNQSSPESFTPNSLQKGGVSAFSILGVGCKESILNLDDYYTSPPNQEAKTDQPSGGLRPPWRRGTEGSENKDFKMEENLVEEGRGGNEVAEIEKIDVKYNLSTMTICGRLGGTINIQSVLENIPIIPYWRLVEGVLRIELLLIETGSKTGNWNYRGICRKYIEKPDKGAGPFKNALTIYYRIFDEETFDAKEPSIKIFRNGGFQITGIRTPYQAKYVVDSIKTTLMKIPGGFMEDIMEEPFTSVSMMNSDITLPYSIRREALQNILKRLGMRSSFESTTYQGVNIKYYWNYEKHLSGSEQTGRCECSVKCISNGKKRMMSSDDKNKSSGCVKITIAPFQTGKIIITGAKNIEQIKDASKWILNLIKDNSSALLNNTYSRKVYTKKSTPFRGCFVLLDTNTLVKYSF
jgi:TATA-box binding protein (TBP) (component of TFIID and TFIIIB)